MKTRLLFIIITLSLLTYPQINFGQAPTLGATSGFALFTASGAFGNTGITTTIIGDIGTNIGTFTGFPPGIVIGNIHVADSVSAQAAIDVDAAYNSLSGVTCDTTIGTTMGNAQTLDARVYCTTAATTIDGNLILDGQGDTSALFIFKINGTLVMSSSSHVVLINSASLKNVYWQINGAVDFGDSATFKGTVIANGAINLLQGASLQGRGLSRAGAISLINNQTSLPVRLLSLNADCNNKNILLRWSTASEINNDYYSIERSTDRMNWMAIGKVAGTGNSSTLKNYSFTDHGSTPGVSYYRLKQTDFNGKFEYSAMITPVKNCAENIAGLVLYPNPTSGKLNLSIPDDSDKIYSLSVYNVIGENVYHSEDDHSTIDLSYLQQGLYFLHFSSSSQNFIQKLIIEK